MPRAHITSRFHAALDGCDVTSAAPIAGFAQKVVTETEAASLKWSKAPCRFCAREIEAHRLELAQHEWARLKANNSLECRNCHGFDLMDFARQSPRAVQAHSTYLAVGEKTCIDCHNGIAHRLPAQAN